MHYWNKPNFEGLAQLATELVERPGLILLAEYCRYREQGLRRQALNTLDSFLDSTAKWESGAARSACRTILELNARTPAAHQFLAQPLLERFLLPTLDDWRREDPNNPTPVRWLAILRRDRDLLGRALELTPSDVPVRRLLVDWFLTDVEHATHHLGESCFLGELEPTKRSLDDARALVDSAPDPSLLADLKKEIKQHDVLLDDWESFSRHPNGSFPEWCVSRGRTYRWPTIVNYEK